MKSCPVGDPNISDARFLDTLILALDSTPAVMPCGHNATPAELRNADDTHLRVTLQMTHAQRNQLLRLLRARRASL